MPLRAGDRAREGGGVRRGGEGARRAGAARRGGGVRASRSPAVGRRGRASLAGGVAEGARRACVWPMGEVGVVRGGERKEGLLCIYSYPFRGYGPKWHNLTS